MTNLCSLHANRQIWTVALWLLLVETVIALTDVDDAASLGTCTNVALQSDAAEATVAAFDHPEVGSCLLQSLQARSAIARLIQTPSDSDQISDAYWNEADQILGAAARSTPKPTPNPVDANGLPVDSGNEDSGHSRPWVTAALTKPWVNAYSRMWADSSQPLSTRIGAAFLYDFSVDEQTMVQATPPPSQQMISSTLQANCPMVLFQHQLDIFPPVCGSEQGTWIDPNSKRVVMRWEKHGHSVHFGVDSAMTGNGSAIFAKIKPQLVLKGYRFSLLNCLNVDRYTVDEAVIKVNKMGDHDQTQSHDPTFDHEQYLLQYSVIDANGTIVMQTNLFRMFSDKVEFTKVNRDAIGQPVPGEVIANADRMGDWKRNGWRSCKRNARGWHLDFPQQPKDLDQLATVLDLRVAATAVLNLMAARDEDRDVKTGLASAGEGEIFMGFAGTFALMLQACLLACCCCVLCVFTGAKDKTRKLFFTIETAVMPKAPMNTKPAPLNPVF